MEIEINKTEIFSWGDIHGKFDEMFDKIKQLELSDCLIIQCGDFGVGPFRGETKDDYLSLFLEYDSFLKKQNVEVIAFRGNHDDPSYFENGFRSKYIRCVPDYTTIITPISNILLLGGAISIDRKNRIEGRSYFKNEGFNYDKEKLTSLRDIDIVMSHTAPSEIYPIGFNSLVFHYSNFDEKLLKDLNIERQLMSNAYKDIIKNNKIREWHYGHFHNAHNSLYGDVRFVLNDINQFTNIIYDKRRL